MHLRLELLQLLQQPLVVSRQPVQVLFQRKDLAVRRRRRLLYQPLLAPRAVCFRALQVALVLCFHQRQQLPVRIATIALGQLVQRLPRHRQPHFCGGAADGLQGEQQRLLKE